MPIFLDFLMAHSLALQPAKAAPVIEYSREAGKDEQYPWLCLWKAALVADAVLGARSAACREQFMTLMQLASVQVGGPLPAGGVAAAAGQQACSALGAHG